MPNRNKAAITRGIANKGFSGIRRVVARFKFSCTWIGNRPQSLTGQAAKPYTLYRANILTRMSENIYLRETKTGELKTEKSRQH